jgi:thymidylate synthase
VVVALLARLWRYRLLEPRPDLPALQKRLTAVGARKEYGEVRAWLEETAPPEPGEEGYDHVPGLLTQLSREPRQRPTIEVADRPLDALEYDDVRLHGYDPAPGLEFAVAE